MNDDTWAVARGAALTEALRDLESANREYAAAVERQNAILTLIMLTLLGGFGAVLGGVYWLQTTDFLSRVLAALA